MKLIQKISVWLLMTGGAVTYAQAVVGAFNASLPIASENPMASSAALCFTVEIPFSDDFAGAEAFQAEENPIDALPEHTRFTVFAPTRPGDVGPELTPEPVSAGLILLGAAGMLLRRRVKQTS